MSPRSTFRLIVRFGIILLILILISVLVARAPRTSRAVGQPITAYPILFVTQLPIAGDFTTIGSTFGNHKATMQSVGRGGDLWIRYPDGTLKNLTQAAGYGVTGFQDDNAIAVRDPSVHWDGNKAIFSMVIGAPENQYQWETYYWQLYEITGLGQNDTPVIAKVPNQPENFNNIVRFMARMTASFLRLTGHAMGRCTCTRSWMSMNPRQPIRGCGAWTPRREIYGC